MRNARPNSVGRTSSQDPPDGLAFPVSIHLVSVLGSTALLTTLPVRVTEFRIEGLLLIKENSSNCSSRNIPYIV